MSAGTWESHHAITTLMYEYADCVDRADFDGIGALFTQGAITQHGVPGAVPGPDGVANLYRSTNKVHADGTLRTRHLTANAIVDIDEDAGTAAARSVFVVFQCTAATPLQPIVSGRYRDRFARTEGPWHFVEREMHVEHLGNVADHLSEAVLALLGQQP